MLKINITPNFCRRKPKPSNATVKRLLLDFNQSVIQMCRLFSPLQPRGPTPNTLRYKQCMARRMQSAGQECKATSHPPVATLCFKATLRLQLELMTPSKDNSVTAGFWQCLLLSLSSQIAFLTCLILKRTIPRVSTQLGCMIWECQYPLSLMISFQLTLLGEVINSHGLMLKRKRGRSSLRKLSQK